MFTSLPTPPFYHASGLIPFIGGLIVVFLCRDRFIVEKSPKREAWIVSAILLAGLGFGCYLYLLGALIHIQVFVYPVILESSLRIFSGVLAFFIVPVNWYILFTTRNHLALVNSLIVLGTILFYLGWIYSSTIPIFIPGQPAHFYFHFSSYMIEGAVFLVAGVTLFLVTTIMKYTK